MLGKVKVRNSSSISVGAVNLTASGMNYFELELAKARKSGTQHSKFQCSNLVWDNEIGAAFLSTSSRVVPSGDETEFSDEEFISTQQVIFSSTL